MPDPQADVELAREFLFCACGTAKGGGGRTWLTFEFSTASESPAEGLTATPVCRPKLLVVTLLIIVKVSRTKLMEYPARSAVLDVGCQATPIDGAKLV